MQISIVAHVSACCCRGSAIRRIASYFTLASGTPPITTASNRNGRASYFGHKSFLSVACWNRIEGNLDLTQANGRSNPAGALVSTTPLTLTFENLISVPGTSLPFGKGTLRPEGTVPNRIMFFE